jgi:hypothetical protein
MPYGLDQIIRTMREREWERMRENEREWERMGENERE